MKQKLPDENAFRGMSRVWETLETPTDYNQREANNTPRPEGAKERKTGT